MRKSPNLIELSGKYRYYIKDYKSNEFCERGSTKGTVGRYKIWLNKIHFKVRGKKFNQSSRTLSKFKHWIFLRTKSCCVRDMTLR